MRILDPSGVTQQLIESNYPEATVHNAPDDNGPYDAVMLYADLDNKCDPAEWITGFSAHVRKPGGRIYVSLPEGRINNRTTTGRQRAFRGIDIADLLLQHGHLEEFGIDDEGYISACIEPFNKAQEIAIWTGFTIGPWHPNDILTKGMGGSETAAWRLAETLSDRGNKVTLYGQFSMQGAMKNVILKDYRTFDPTFHRDILITFRNAEMFDMKVNVDTAMLWLEDVAGAEGLNDKRLKNIDYICGVSNWHRNNILEHYPYCPKHKVIASRNGIVHEFFEGDNPEREKRVIFSSSPDRGLDIVLECWPEIVKKVPDATLYHTYGPWYDIVAKHNSGIKAHRDRIAELDKLDSVHGIKGMPQDELAMLMRSSLVWVAPSYNSPSTPWGKAHIDTKGIKFDETSCISAMEAQAAGCYVVCGNWGALSETVQTGAKLDGDPMSDEWRQSFITEVVLGLTDPATQEKAQKEGPEKMAGNDWHEVGTQLEKLAKLRKINA